MIHARLWLLVLLAPVSWAAALGMLFSLSNETCISGSRGAPIAVALVCVVLAALPAGPAWHWRRNIDGGTAGAERMRVMLELALGGSVLFTAVTLLTAVPTVLLDPCRT